MKKTVDELEQAASNQAVQEILNNSLSSLPQSSSTSLSSEIESTPQRLKEYLQHLFRMEMNIYSLSKHLSSLYFKRYQIERTITLKHAVSKIELEKKLSEAKSAYQECLNAPDPENIIPLEVDSVPDPIKPIEPTAPTLKKPGFFNKKKILAENALLTADYEQALLQYEKDCRIYDEKMKQADDERKRNLELATKVKEIKVRDARKEQQQKTRQALETLNQLQAEASVTPLSGIKELLAKEISDAEKLLKSTIECKNRLYSYDIVFKKYHSIIPLATFCEYLESGRCTTLQGNDGAYNLYEVECRANRIIDQLSQIITSLDQIKSNQYLIYSELCVVNENLSSLDDKMSCVIRYLDKNNMYLENISANSETIAYNSEVTAYYSKKNAELTNAMGYLIALK